MSQSLKSKKDVEMDPYKKCELCLEWQEEKLNERGKTHSRLIPPNSITQNGSRELNVIKQIMKVAAKQKTKTPTGGSTYEGTRKP